MIPMNSTSRPQPEPGARRTFLSPSMNSAALCLAMAALAWPASAPAAAEPSPAASPSAAVPNAPVKTVDRGQLERKLQSTQTLFNQSSGALQIKASKVQAAMDGHQSALALHAQAAKALAAGDLAQTSALLDQASQAFFKAVRLAEPEQVTGDKVRVDFENRLSSTRALVDAQKRIAQEKAAGPRAAELSRKMETMMAEAQALAKSGKLDEGRRLLDEAYQAAKAAIGGLRHGETVVRSLNFASKAEEYHYEVDRNETHSMLVKVLLKDRRGNAQVDAMVDKATAAAQVLRQEADALAARKDYEAAIQKIEESTRELVRGIRSAGVYIPG